MNLAQTRQIYLSSDNNVVTLDTSPLRTLLNSAPFINLKPPKYEKNFHPDDGYPFA